MQVVARFLKTKTMKTYKVTQKVQAIKARELRQLYVDPYQKIPKEFLPALNAGRLKFYTNHITLDGEIIDSDDYVAITEDGDHVPVTNKYFQERFEKDE